MPVIGFLDSDSPDLYADRLHAFRGQTKVMRSRRLSSIIRAPCRKVEGIILDASDVLDNPFAVRRPRIDWLRPSCLPVGAERP
jgi:hypothetical protein